MSSTEHTRRGWPARPRAAVAAALAVALSMLALSLVAGVAPRVEAHNVPTSGDQTNAEGDSVSLQWSSPDGAGVFTASNLPPGLSISSDGLISGLISAGAADGSPYAVVVHFDPDGEGHADRGIEFSWTVTASPGGGDAGAGPGDSGHNSRGDDPPGNQYSRGVGGDPPGSGAGEALSAHAAAVSDGHAQGGDPPGNSNNQGVGDDPPGNAGNHGKGH